MSDESSNFAPPPPPPPPPPAFSRKLHDKLPSASSVNSVVDRSLANSPAPAPTMHDELANKLKNPTLKPIPNNASERTLDGRDALLNQISAGQGNLKTHVGIQNTEARAALNIKLLDKDTNFLQKKVLQDIKQLYDTSSKEHQDSLIKAVVDKLKKYKEPDFGDDDAPQDYITIGQQNDCIKDLYEALKRNNIPVSEAEQLLLDAKILSQEKSIELIRDADAEIVAKQNQGNTERKAEERSERFSNKTSQSLSHSSSQASLDSATGISRSTSQTSLDQATSIDRPSSPALIEGTIIELQLSRLATRPGIEGKIEVLSKILKTTPNVSTLSEKLQTRLTKAVESVLSDALNDHADCEEELKTFASQVKKSGIKVFDEDALECLSQFASKESVGKVVASENLKRTIESQAASRSESQSSLDGKPTENKISIPDALKTFAPSSPTQATKDTPKSAPAEPLHNTKVAINDVELQKILQTWSANWDQSIEAKSAIPTPPPIELMDKKLSAEQTQLIRDTLSPKFEQWSSVPKQEILSTIANPGPGIEATATSRPISEDVDDFPPPPPLTQSEIQRDDLIDDLPPPPSPSYSTIPDDLISREKYEKRLHRFYETVVNNPEFGTLSRSDVEDIVKQYETANAIDRNDPTTLSKSKERALLDRVFLDMYSPTKLHAQSERVEHVASDLKHRPAPPPPTKLPAQSERVEHVASDLKHRPAPPPPTKLHAQSERVEHVASDLKHRPAPPPPTKLLVQSERVEHVASDLKHRPAPPPPTKLLAQSNPLKPQRPAPTRPDAPAAHLKGTAEEIGKSALAAPAEITIKSSTTPPSKETYHFIDSELKQFKPPLNLLPSSEAKANFHSIFALTKKFDAIKFTREGTDPVIFKNRDERAVFRKEVLRNLTMQLGHYQQYATQDWYSMQKDAELALKKGHRLDEPQSPLTKHGRELLEGVRDAAYVNFLGKPNSPEKTQLAFQEIRYLSDPGRKNNTEENNQLHKYLGIYKKNISSLNKETLDQNAQSMKDLALIYPENKHLATWQDIGRLSNAEAGNPIEKIFNAQEKHHDSLITKIKSTISHLFSKTKSAKESDQLTSIVAYELNRKESQIPQANIPELDNTLRDESKSKKASFHNKKEHYIRKR
jgi:hypothetical protein